MCGHKEPYRPVVEAVLEEGLTSKKGRKHFIRGQLKFENGSYSVRSTGSQGRGILLSMSKADCLIIIPDEGGEFPAGTKVKTQLLGRQDRGQKAPGY